MRAKTVLIVDDDFEVHDRLSALLRRHGIDSVSAGSATAAKAALDICRVDAILIDDGMASDDGRGALAALREVSDAPAYLLSEPQSASDADLRRAGAKGVIPKPLADAQVEQALAGMF